MQELDSLKAELASLKAELVAKKSEMDGKKLAINGSFGKLGSKWSTLYSPHLMIQVTISGQLSLLMLIEALEVAGIPVVSGNTDGIVIKCPTRLREKMLQIVKWWEAKTGFETEETQYAALYSRDVNNYVAVKPDGKVKLKGAYAESGLQKNPSNQICVEAAVSYITKGLPVEDTIVQCNDVRKFVTVRSVTGGAVKVEGYAEVDDWVQTGEREWKRQAWIDDGNEKVEKRKSRPNPVIVADKTQYVGKAIRWVYGRGEDGALIYKTNGNKVPRSEGAVPLMDLPEELPDFIDYDWYIREAYSILRDIGHPKFQWDARSDSLI